MSELQKKKNQGKEGKGKEGKATRTMVIMLFLIFYFIYYFIFAIIPYGIWNYYFCDYSPELEEYVRLVDIKLEYVRR